ncbi:molybdenum cofactor guanylyltransferase [Solitalea longa]|uniref:Molybdenum cofactor guanylyltransferase n=1 Tax=Solitalea longa TaxID=2079460 RepID=A0A2S5A149_9SPHI|nr:NTP transferase domain-containing protein [Solitalea longa]POY36318.1 molybdenum cofactor guanylyltransferase [Solitalea longa]
MILNENKTPLNALILCGGYSRRMQMDKFVISYHQNIPQWLYLYDLVKPLVNDVYISCRTDQKQVFLGDYKLIEDAIEGSGPSIGLISAHQLLPDAAWMVIACDLPLLTDQSLRYLIEKRDQQKSATSFISPVNNLPEPLIAIWEPSGLNLLTENVADGLNCPRKTLLSTEIELLVNQMPDEQLNANTPEEMQQVIKMLN